jgi:hypothetical protein
MSSVTEAQSIHGAGTKIFDENIHALDKPSAEFDAFGMLEVDGDAPLPAV